MDTHLMVARRATPQDVPGIVAMMKRIQGDSRGLPWEIDHEYFADQIQRGLESGFLFGFLTGSAVLIGEIKGDLFNPSVKRANAGFAGVEGPFEKLIPVLHAFERHARSMAATHVTVDLMQTTIHLSHGAFDQFMRDVGYHCKWHEWSRSLV